MGIFHVKQGTLVAKALPNKSKLKDDQGICMNFCFHGRKYTFPHQLCNNGKHYTNWKNIPNKDKPVLLEHMNNTNLFWFNGETMEKHKINLAPKYAHLLGDASGPKPKAAKIM
jgi:hypothetical protein